MFRLLDKQPSTEQQRAGSGYGDFDVRSGQPNSSQTCLPVYIKVKCYHFGNYVVPTLNHRYKENTTPKSHGKVVIMWSSRWSKRKGSIFKCSGRTCWPWECDVYRAWLGSTNLHFRLCPCPAPCPPILELLSRSWLHLPSASVPTHSNPSPKQQPDWLPSFQPTFLGPTVCQMLCKDLWTPKWKIHDFWTQGTHKLLFSRESSLPMTMTSFPPSKHSSKCLLSSSHPLFI